MRALAEAHGRLREENAALRHEISERDRRVATLEADLRQANQRRQDVAKRIDDLISQIDHLDAQLEQSPGPGV